MNSHVDANSAKRKRAHKSKGRGRSGEWKRRKMKFPPLPISKARNAIQQAVKDHKNLIIVAETGSGKTTQVPQYLDAAGWTKHGTIAITQPRRVAAITVAARVAQEQGVRLGTKVGYTIRFDDKTTKKTKLKYMTDGMLLREILIDPLLRSYSVVILDEAHERTLNTDLLFALLKDIQKKRTNLRVLAMSATLSTQEFSRYFDYAPVISVKGRVHDVSMLYADRRVDEHVDAAVTTIIQLHGKDEKGDILVFLTGQNEIENVKTILNDKIKQFPKNLADMFVVPLYAALPAHDQVKAFDATPAGKRKVILSTNIAETSVTINGVAFVVDCGLAKKRQYAHNTGTEVLVNLPISKSEAWQRAGRAGRERKGSCYRLYTEDYFENKLRKTPVPEILRSNLCQVVLQLKALNVEDVLAVDFIDKPSKESIESAIEILTELGAINKTSGKLCELGRQMVKLPLRSTYAKVLIRSSDFHCSEEILTIVSMLSVEKIFISSETHGAKARQAKKRFQSGRGDHFTLLNAYNAAKDMGFDHTWCRTNFLSCRELQKAQNVRKQLEQIYIKMGLTKYSCGENFDQVAKCFITGFFRNVALLDRNYSYVIWKQDPKSSGGMSHMVKIHPSSVLFNKKPKCVIFNDKILTTKQWIRNVIAIEYKWIPEVLE